MSTPIIGRNIRAGIVPGGFSHTFGVTTLPARKARPRREISMTTIKARAADCLAKRGIAGQSLTQSNFGS